MLGDTARWTAGNIARGIPLEMWWRLNGDARWYCSPLGWPLDSPERWRRFAGNQTGMMSQLG